MDGFRERTPWTDAIDLHADYAIPLGGNRRLLLLADAFNAFDSQDVLNYDNYTQFEAGVPDFGRVIGYQTPRQARVGVRFTF